MTARVEHEEPALPRAAIRRIVSHVLEGHRSGRCVDPIEAAFDHPVDMASAYAVHWDLVGRKLEDPALCRRGYKIGMTRRRAGTFSPVYGVLLSNSLVPTGASISGERLRQPYPEAEVGFVVREPIERGMDVRAVVDRCEVLLTLEVTDSRYCYDDWPAEITDAALVCDQTASALLVSGAATVMSAELDHVLRERHELSVDGEVVEIVTQRDDLLHPVQAMGWLVAALDLRGEGLEVGDVVSTGRRSRTVRRIGRGTTVELVSSMLGSVAFDVA